MYAAAHRFVGKLSSFDVSQSHCTACHTSSAVIPRSRRHTGPPSASRRTTNAQSSASLISVSPSPACLTPAPRYSDTSPPAGGFPGCLCLPEGLDFHLGGCQL